MTVIGELYGGLPLWIQILYWIVLIVIVSSSVSIVTLLVLAGRFGRRMRRRDEQGPLASEADFLWAFVVPALDKEVTIADSVARLRETHATNAVFLVVDDGSTDRTPEILAGIDDPRLRVLTRTAPEARTGKAAALNAAYRHLREVVLREPEHAMWTQDRVILVVVDADGRLDPQAPAAVARHFADPGVGAAQLLVRIYNRRGWLTWAQDVEFSAFGRVLQAGRSWWGTANMGGNGQFTRLAALAAVDEGAGPWRDRLTEDQDLGVRLVQAGWAGVQENGAEIHQQGLNSLRRLYRQRVRWAQGNWQALGLLRGAGRPRIPFLGRLDSVFYLITPMLQLVTGIGFAVSIGVWAFGVAPYRPAYWWVIVFFLALAFGPGIITLVLRGGRWYSPFVALVLVVPYSVYSWMVFPVLAIALVRQLSGRRSWAKTAREGIEGTDAVAPVPATSA